MKKVIKSFIATLIIFGSVTSVMAYSSSASCELAWYAGFARSDEVGYGTSADFSANSYYSSISLMRLEAWASWKGAIYPWTKESSVNIAPGRSAAFTEPMSRQSVFRVELRPGDNTYRANGKGYVSLN